MNDKITIHNLLAALMTLALFSCSQQEPGADSDAPEDDHILFYTSMPGVEVTSRSYDNIQEGDLQGGFSVAAIAPEIPSGGGKQYTIYFPPQLVTRTPGMGNAFRGDFCKWPDYTETNLGEGKLDFCAFYPSLETMREKSGVGSDPNFFIVHDLPSSYTIYSYRMGNFKINNDILNHMDFVAAFASGSKTENLYSGISLAFEHKLCKVDFKAFNSNPSYDIEIAGVRIGGVITKSTYNMNGNWIHNNLIHDCVDYIYREGDTVVKLGKGSHDTGATSVSIMGNGGSALLIPHQPSNLGTSYPGFPFAWDYKNNPTNTKKAGTYANLTVNGSNYGMYFSVLLRVIDKTDDQGLVLYPYLDGALITGTTTASNKNAVYLAVETASGKVVKRVYKNKTTKQYYADASLTTLYSPAQGVEVREYGWAAIPCRASWEINKQYVHTFNYTPGVGVHAPDDDAPGKAIITDFSVGVSQNEGVWKMVKAYENEEIELDWNSDKIHQE